LNGCTDLTFEERGQYITLLCLQHQKGHLSEKTIRLCVGSVSVDVLSKFEIDDEGCYYNSRMENEITKRQQFIDSRHFNGRKGGRPPKPNSKPNSKPNKEPTNNLLEDENINEDLSNIDRYWIKWKSYKKAEFNFKYKSKASEDAAKSQLLNLCGGDEQTAIKIIEQSIAHGWKGLFKLNANGTDKKDNGATPAEIAQIIAQKFGSDR